MNWYNLLNSDRLRPSTRKNPVDARNAFESDFGRIIFSPALRRMHDKTQVFPLTTDDNIHSRLTHSMEVMSVGYSLGVRLCESDIFTKKLNKEPYELFREIPIILKNSCLIHDIGNPPFGHFGETIIQDYFKNFFGKNLVKENINQFTDEEQKGEKLCLVLNKHEISDFTEFDGNAQGLRVLTKLQYLNDEYGLNLTFATLGAYIKYPNYKDLIKEKGGRLETKKRGVFQSEKNYLDKIVDKCGLKIGENYIRHPLCYLMEAADTICYLAMDIEDGYNKKLYDIDFLYKELKIIPSIKDKIEYIFKDEKNIYINNTTKVVNFRIEIIQTLVNLAFQNFEKNIDEIEKGTYSKELIYDDDDKLGEILMSICKKKVFKYREIVSLEITGHSVITGLLDNYINFAFHKDKDYRGRLESLISNSIVKAALKENHLSEDSKFDDLNDYYKLRVIVDFISGMTDQFALDHYQKISGQKIS